MTNPLGGALGTIYLGGWVGEAPTGQDEAFLLLTTDDERAPITMAVIADLLGMADAPGTPVASPEVCVTIGNDGWVTLHLPGERLARPVHDEWRQIAQATERVVLVVGTAPMPAGLGPDTYTERYGQGCRIGLVPLR